MEITIDAAYKNFIDDCNRQSSFVASPNLCPVRPLHFTWITFLNSLHSVMNIMHLI